jgi:hypothetical protein
VPSVTEPGSERERLGFREAVLKSFAFLSGYGLKVVQEESTFVRYESKIIFVNFYHGRASYEIGVEIGRLDRSEKYGLTYIVSTAGKDAWEKEGFGQSTMFQVSTIEGVLEFVPKVAELIKKYGCDFLRGDSIFYDQLERVNKRRAIEYTKRQNLDQIRKKAEAAWSRKDFSAVVRFYQSITTDLTEIESKRLAYARTHQHA